MAWRSIRVDIRSSAAKYHWLSAPKPLRHSSFRLCMSDCIYVCVYPSSLRYRSRGSVGRVVGVRVLAMIPCHFAEMSRNTSSAGRDEAQMWRPSALRSHMAHLDPWLIFSPCYSRARARTRYSIHVFRILIRRASTMRVVRSVAFMWRALDLEIDQEVNATWRRQLRDIYKFPPMFS
jgi:hypothetical protein